MLRVHLEVHSQERGNVTLMAENSKNKNVLNQNTKAKFHNIDFQRVRESLFTKLKEMSRPSN